MQYEIPFTPIAATITFTIATAGTDVVAALNASAAPYDGTIRVYNDIPSVIFLAWGDGSVEATAASLPIGPQATEAITIPLSATHLSVLCPGATGAVYVTQGRGS